MHAYVPLVLLSLAVGAGTAIAQDRSGVERPGRESLPAAVAREVATLYAEPHALRGTQRTEIAAVDRIAGNVAVLDGPLVIAGRIDGRVLAINSDVIVRAGARIAGDVIVVGGEIERERGAEIGGEVRRYRPRLAYTRVDDRLVVDEDAVREGTDDESWWRRWERRRSRDTESRLVIASAGAYNRVEGLPVNVGPAVAYRRPWGTLEADFFAVLRTETSFREDASDESQANDVGHDLRLEVRTGRRSGIILGASAYSVVAPVEAWQFSPLEYGLAAFLFRRDYRDLFARHGGRAVVGVHRQGLGELTASFAHERWGSRSSSDPATLFRSDEPWRANPAMDAARVHLVTVAARFDTRNDDDRPWSGWYVTADVERGSGELTALGTAPGGTSTTQLGALTYSRGFLDARRYNRVGPASQLNFRLVTGGWLSGDPLPLQRRLSVSGAGALPGFDFRTPIRPGADVGTCTVGDVVPGRPALCDRIALAQVEFRGDIHFDPFGGFDWGNETTHFDTDPVWVVFADAGRGWLVGGQASPLRYQRGVVPPPSTFRTDLGAGLDFNEFGVFVAKALSDGAQPLNFLFRLRHRF